MARISRDANQVRGLLALAIIYEGGTPGDPAHLDGIGLQTGRLAHGPPQRTKSGQIGDAPSLGGGAVVEHRSQDIERRLQHQIAASGHRIYCRDIAKADAVEVVLLATGEPPGRYRRSICPSNSSG